MKNGSQRSEARNQKPENAKQMTEIERQRSELRIIKPVGTAFCLTSVFCFLSSVFCFLFSVFCLSPAAHAAEVNAKAAVVIDSATEKILYAKNPHWRLQPASTTKLVTAMVSMDRLNPDSIITISENAANTPSVSPRLRAGEKYSVKEMLYLALMRSVNSAAVALAEATAGSEDRFVTMMNEKVALLGAENTWFANASGLPGPGQYITAFDLAKIMKEAIKYPLIREAINTRTKDIYSEGGRRLVVRNTNHLLWTDDNLIGGKTGYTRAAGHCLVCAAQKGENTLITAVLGEHVRDNVWQDSNALLVRGMDVIAQKSEPVIYLTSANESPVVFASYSGKAKKKSKKLRYKKARKTMVFDDGTVQTVEKKHKTNKKKKGSPVKLVKKGKRSPGKNLSRSAVKPKNPAGARASQTEDLS